MVTLNDIAKRMGVTSSTVQRALTGAAGVSDIKRAKIQKIADEMGYKRNHYAASLKRGIRKIAVVLPDTSSHNRYYGRYLWEGVDQYLHKFSAANLDILRLQYEISPHDHVVLLNSVLEGKYGKVDGVITRGSKAKELSNCLLEFENKNIPVILAGADSEPRHRICCVKNHEEMAGRLVADLLLNFGEINSQSSVIVCGNFTTVNQYNNSLSFEAHLWEGNVHPNIMKVSSNIDSSYVKENIKEILSSGLEVNAIYACSARSTIAVCEAVKEIGLKHKIHTIGSDIFAESIDFLKEGVLNAVIHGKPLEVAYQSIQAMDYYLALERKKPPETIGMDSIVVMKSNLEYYI